jgi:hypothetical protein
LAGIKQRSLEAIYGLQVIVAKENDSAILQTASKFWWDNNGHIPVHHIAASFMISINKLTIEIQRQMSIKTRVKLPNTAPNITVMYSKTEIDYLAKKHNNQKFEYSLEFFFYLANPKLIQQLHETNTPENTTQTVGNYRNEH